MVGMTTEFNNIFKVYRGCDDFPVNITKFDDSTYVMRRMLLPSSIEFFCCKIGASQFTLNTLQLGHHPTLTGPIPAYKIENHSNFRKHIDFVLSMIAKGRVEIVEKETG